MKSKFSSSWKASKQPRKQRKYIANAPLHLKGKLLSSHLSKELQQKHGMRSIRVRTGDRVKVLRGQFKGTEGKIESVDTKNSRVYLPKIEVMKRDGSKAKRPINASNLIVIDLNTSDKKRLKQKEGSKNAKKSS